VLDQVGRDAGVGVPRGRALTALKIDLDRVGLAMFRILSVIAFTSSRE
jgi:hypothetical protein